MFKSKNKSVQKIISIVLISVAVVLITAVLIIINPLETWHLKLSNSLYTHDNPSEDIVILSIDERSISAEPIGLGKFNDWRRTYYADVIDKLNEAEVKVIGIDLLFSEKSKDIPQEEINKIFIKTIIHPDEAEKGVFAETFNKYHKDKDHPDDLALKDSLAENVILAGGVQAKKQENKNFVFNINDLTKTIFPLSLLVDSYSEQVGIIQVVQNIDSLVRKIPLTILDENKEEYNAFSLKIAQKFNEKLDTSEIPLEDGYMLVNYFGTPYSYNYISFRDVFYDNYNFPDFKDKIVLIGVTTTKAAQDSFNVPTNVDVSMPGIEVHANAIQTILDEKYLQNQSMLSQIITISIVSIVGTLIFTFLNIWIGIGCILLFIVGYTGLAHLAYRNGTILNMIYPYAAILFSYIASIIYKYFIELKDKIYVQGAFKRYLSPNVMNEVLKNPEMLELGGTKREITVFFTDIAGFTSIAEKMNPEKLIELVNEYLSAMTQVVLKNEGTLDKYVGDAIVAFFGAPISQEDHAKRACNTALEMRSVLVDLHKKWKQEEKPLLDFRVGVNTGNAIVGNIGSENRFDYTIMGDEVNLGSRLEGVNKKYGTKILISEPTYNFIGDAFITREVDIIKVKGKDKPVAVYELLARKGELAETGEKLLEKYNNGMKLYKERNFKEAHLAFKEALEVYAEDKMSELYAVRCEILSNFPPPDDWDGVFSMKTK